MLLGFKTKLKLNNRQKTIMAKHAGYSRWVFNWGLKAWSVTYKEGLKPTANKLKKFYTNYVKPHYIWQSQLSSRVYQYAFVDLDNATVLSCGQRRTGRATCGRVLKSVAADGSGRSRK